MLTVKTQYIIHYKFLNFVKDSKNRDSFCSRWQKQQKKIKTNSGPGVYVGTDGVMSVCAEEVTIETKMKKLGSKNIPPFDLKTLPKANNATVTAKLIKQYSFVKKKEQIKFFEEWKQKQKETTILKDNVHGTAIQGDDETAFFSLLDIEVEILSFVK